MALKNPSLYTVRMGKFFQTTQIVLYHLIAFWATGQNSFIVDFNFAEMLVKANIGKLQLSDVVLPYDSFYVAVNNCPLKIWGDERTGWHNVSGFYVKKVPNKNGNFEIAFCLVGRHNNINEVAYQYVCSNAHLDSNSIDNFIISFINKCTKHDEKNVSVEALVFLARFAMAFCVYLSTKNKEIEEFSFEKERSALLREAKRIQSARKGKNATKDSARLLKRAQSLSSCKFTYVGRGISDKIRETDQRKKLGMHAIMPHMVRRHVNFYHCGTGVFDIGSKKQILKIESRIIEPHKRGTKKIKEEQHVRIYKVHKGRNI